MALEGPRRHPARTSGPPACPLVRRPRATPRLGRRGSAHELPPTTCPEPRHIFSPRRVQHLRGKRTLPGTVRRSGTPAHYLDRGSDTRSCARVRVAKCTRRRPAQVLGGGLPTPPAPPPPTSEPQGCRRRWGSWGTRAGLARAEATPGRIPRQAQDSQTWAAPGGQGGPAQGTRRDKRAQKALTLPHACTLTRTHVCTPTERHTSSLTQSRPASSPETSAARVFPLHGEHLSHMAEAVWPRDGNPRPSGASSPEPWDSQSESSCCLSVNP